MFSAHVLSRNHYFKERKLVRGVGVDRRRMYSETDRSWYSDTVDDTSEWP